MTKGSEDLANRVFFNKKEVPIASNMPIHMWGKAGQYLKKMGTIILFASILIWALGYFPLNRTTMADETEHLENSYI